MYNSYIVLDVPLNKQTWNMQLILCKAVIQLHQFIAHLSPETVVDILAGQGSGAHVLSVGKRKRETPKRKLTA